MSDASKDQFDVVVVTEGRSIGRVGRAFWRWVWVLEDMGIFVAIVDGDIDNTTTEGRREMRRQADYAETEWELIRSRTQGGLQEKAELDGAPHIGGRPPYGYRIEGKGERGSYLVVNKHEEEVILYVYEMVVFEGLSIEEAALRLNIESKLTRSQKPWTKANLRDRILSPAIIHGEQIFRGDHAAKGANGVPIWGEQVTIQLPRILAEDEASALVKKSRRRKRKKDAAPRSFYPLSRRIIGLCGAHYTGSNRESWSGARNYQCSGKSRKLPGDSVCDCSLVNASAIESRVWSEVVPLLGNSNKLEELAAEWVGMLPDNLDAHSDRIADLDNQIEIQSNAISAVIAASAKQAAKLGRDEHESAKAIEQATASLNDELKALVNMWNEAQAWMNEMEESAQRSRDLMTLAKVARKQLPDMLPEEQAEILDLLDLKVFVEGPVPARSGGVPCTVQAWYHARERDVPAADLTDEEWEEIAPLLPPSRRGAARRVVDAILYKARTGVTWRSLPERYGAPGTASQYFSRWVKNGVWDRIEAVLSGAHRVPLPTFDLLPPVRIEGRVDPRVMLQPAEASR